MSTPSSVGPIDHLAMRAGTPNSATLIDHPILRSGSNQFNTLQRPKSLYKQISTTTDASIKCLFCLECFDLLDVFNTATGVSTFAAVSVTNDTLSYQKTWTTIGKTYVVKNNSNPQFHEREFGLTDVVLDAGHVMIQIFALHPANKMPVCIGACQIAIKEILHSDTVIRKLRGENWQQGTVVVYVKVKKESKYPNIDDIVEYCSMAETTSNEDTSQITSSEDDTKYGSFKDILGTITRQRFHFNLRPQLSRSLRVREEMYELATSFSLPALYIRLLCEREHSNMLVLKGMTQGFSEEVSSITSLSRASKMCQYRADLVQLGKVSKHPFKRSEWKALPEYKWAPINLHAQLLDVESIDSRTKSSYRQGQLCIMTVGAMAGHWDKFKSGGLASLLSPKCRDGEKFADRMALYKVLRKVEKCQEKLCTSQADFSSVSDLIALSKEQVAGEALEGLQRTLQSDKQLQIMTLSADLEKVVKGMKDCSVAEIAEVCGSYSLHVQRALVWAITQLELDNREHFLGLLNRYEACFSQLLASVASAFVATLCFRKDDPILHQQLKAGLVPIMFESLLSTHGDELGMLEDMMFVLQHIDTLSIKMEKCGDEEQVRVTHMTGSPSHITMFLSAPEDLLSALPANLRRGDSVKFLGLFFSHGINEQQTIAYKMGETSLQDKICERFLRETESYIREYVTPNMDIFNFKVENCLSQNVEKLHSLYKVTKRAKSSDFIASAEQIGRDIGCIRFTSCKSAKDRTSMSLTYEYACVLCRDFELQWEDAPAVLEQFRRDGTRYHNTFKNIGSYKYCFNKLQCKMLPAVYKPPPGTFGDGAQQI